MNGHCLHSDIRCQKPEDQRAGEHHNGTGAAHENGTHGGTDVTETFCCFKFSGTDVASNQCGCSHTKTIAWHVAQTFCGNGERICSDGSGSQWGNDPGGYDHSTVHSDFLNGHRHSNLKCFAQNITVKMMFVSTSEVQLLVADAAAPCHGQTDDGTGECRSHTGTKDTEAWNQ